MSAGVDPKNFPYQGFLPDGTINFDSQQVMFEIAWQRPEDYNINTGLADPYSSFGGADRQPLQSFVYQARKCTSEFRQGKFEQAIEGSLYRFPITEQRNTAATQPASVSAEADGRSARISDVFSLPDLKLPGIGPIAAPPVIDAVQLSPGNFTQVTPLDPTAISDAQNRPASGLGVEPLSLPAPTPPNQQQQITDRSNQQISIDT